MAKKRTHPKPAPASPDDSNVVYVTRYEVTDEPIYDRRFRRLPQPVKDEIEALYEKAKRSPWEAIPDLLEMIQLYPDLPMLYNFLTVAYGRAGQKEALERTIEENLRRNPDYLFARLNYAEILMARGEVERIPEIFENKLELTLLYPKRKRFHISEVINFTGIMGWYFVEVGQREIAEKHYELLKELDLHHEMTTRLRRKLAKGWFNRLLLRFRKG